jgi:hypothetical protein
MITKLVSDGVTTKFAADSNENAFEINGRTLAEVLESEKAYYDRRFEGERKTTAKNFEAAEKLANAGLSAGFLYCTSIHIELEPEQIPDYARVLGPFEHRSKEPVDDTDDVILVTMGSKAYPSVHVSYRRPVQPTDKCKVVTETEPAHKRRYVACSI